MFRDALDSPELKINTSKKLEDYDEYDSLSAMLLVDAIKDDIGVDIDIEKLGGMSFNDILKIYGN